MQDNTSTIKLLQQTQETIAKLTTQLRKAEAVRDYLVNKLADNEGAHDRHPVAVR
jgi:hypothetical protein